MYKFIPYILTAHTNLHVGNGETNIGIVDNQVQRDPITGLPSINASSLKGAIRNHFADFLKDDATPTDDPDAVKPHHYRVIFGLDIQQQDAVNKKASELSKRYQKLPKQGLVNFLEAHLLFLPVRGRKKPFYHATSIALLEQYSELLKQLGYKTPEEQYSKLKLYIPASLHDDKKSVIFGTDEDSIEEIACEVQDETEDIRKLKRLFGINDLVLLPHKDLKELAEELPVVARNQLDNGESKNLWYEEIVPRRTIFGFVLGYYDRIAPSDAKPFVGAFKTFEEKLTADLVQVGANASIGYGLCRIKSMGQKYQDTLTSAEEVHNATQEG